MFCKCFSRCVVPHQQNQVTGKVVGEINQQSSRQEHTTETTTDRMF